MTGINIAARAVVVFLDCSPPFGLSDVSDNFNVCRACVGDVAGSPTVISDNTDGATVVEGVHNPVLSPDGTKIAFIQALAATNRGALYVCSSTPGSTPTQLEDDATSWINAPMWSPDSSTLVFARGNAAGNIYGGTIETIPASGGSPTVLYTPSAGYRSYRPSYNYDGTRIAFINEQSIGGDDDLFIMDADGSSPTPVATVRYLNDGSRFGWANNSDQLAYDQGASGASDVFVIQGDGTGNTQISLGAVSAVANRCSKFCWLPDDSGVIITSNQVGTRYSLYECDPTGVANAALLNATHGSSTQAWMKQAFVFENRIWFVEIASGASGGTIASTDLTGGDYRVDLNVNAAAAFNWISGGDGFEYQ